MIAITVRSCLAVDYDPDRFQVCVIADNCTDDTAAVAERRARWSTVRTDPIARARDSPSKTSSAARRRPGDPPHDAYVLVDADTSVAPDLLRAFDRSIRRGDDFIQGYYTVRNADASWRTRMLTYAFSLANGVWLAGLDRLGLSVGLKGNGMCFRRDALRAVPLAGARPGGRHGVRLETAARRRARAVPAAGAGLRRDGESWRGGAASQRRRWESGRQALRSDRAFGFVARPGVCRGARKSCYQVDLDFPPLGRLAVWPDARLGRALVGVAWSGGVSRVARCR